MHYHKRILGLAVAMATSAMTQAADIAPGDAPEEITVTATRYPTPAMDVPATVTVISDLEQSLAGDIKALTRYEPNLSVRNNVGRFGLADFNVRGIEGNRVLIEVDDIRVPDTFAIGSFSDATRNSIDLDLLKRVEVVRGSASSLYGSDAIGGVVALTTKDPGDLLGANRTGYFGTRANYSEADSGNSATLSAASRSGRLSALAIYSHQESGDYLNHGSNDTIGAARTTPNPQSGHGNSLLLKSVFDVNENQRLRLTFESTRNDQYTNLLSSVSTTPTLDVTAQTGNDENQRRRLSLEHEFKPASPWVDSGVWRVYGQRSDTTQYTTENRTVRGATTSLRVRDREFDFNQNLTGAELTLHKHWQWGDAVQLTTVGADWRDTHTEQLRTGDERNLTAGTVTSTVGPDNFPVRDFPVSDTRSFSAYVQNETRVGRWIVTPAVRVDRYELTPQPDKIFTDDNPGIAPTALNDTHASPKLGVTWRASDAVALFASYNYGFRMPPYGDVNVGFTNLAFGYTTIPNPQLKPETSHNWETGVKFADGGVRAEFSVFYNTYHDFIESFATVGVDPKTGLLVFQSQNLDAVRIYGAEAKVSVPLGLAGAALDDFVWHAAAGSAKGSNRATGQPLDSIDPLRVTTGLDYQPKNASWKSGIALTWADGKHDVDPASAQFLPGSYLTLDWYGEIKLGDHVRLNAGLFNLTDSKYWDWADVRGRPANDIAIERYTRPGRNFSASLKMEW
ncbi:MAG TPA: TonB-dependent hemoglobin/transferrin/lactoferrin family receptor [Candidatus Acidoferrum sp.]|nr:TonB-dependent hemoglobin/transferrin/lactoferrin family receptor [Candidatus Acidoferrum sp.]